MKSASIKPFNMALIATGVLILLVLSIAEANWRYAIYKAKQSEGSDLAIEKATAEQGFNLAWYEEPTAVDKIKALFNQ